MSVVTRKSEINKYLDLCISAYQEKGLSACITSLNDQILIRKVKFPLLEYCAHQLTKEVKATEQIELCDGIEALKTEGGNVIIGILLQNGLENHFQESIDKTTEYTSKANIWYVCDIIGERVFGYALLHYPNKTLPELRKLSGHSKNWVVRSLGAGIHYAVKKGLNKYSVDEAFSILLKMSKSKDKEIRQGIGWAAKTTARFHPDIIEKYHGQIHNPELTANWFRRKITIGLERHEYYAQRNSG